MKVKNNKISKLLLSFTSIIVIILMSFTCIGCGDTYGDLYNTYPNPNPNAYTQNTKKV